MKLNNTTTNMESIEKQNCHARETKEKQTTNFARQKQHCESSTGLTLYRKISHKQVRKRRTNKRTKTKPETKSYINFLRFCQLQDAMSTGTRVATKNNQ